MDDLGSLIFFVVAFVAAVAAVVFVAWIVVATLMRLIAVLIVYWVAAFSVGVVAGLVAGLIVPLRVLSNRARTVPVIASPAEVVAGNVMTTAPRGVAKHFGWDRAWPVYNPYQSRRDANAVFAETRLVLSVLWQKCLTWLRRPSTVSGPSVSATSRAGSILKSMVTSAPGVIWALFVPIPYIGFFIGMWVSVAFWACAMLVIGGIVYLGQQAWVLVYRWFDQIARKKAQASLKCPKCYRTTTTPSYRCSNPQCTIIHRNISPGPLGIVHRRCECGARLPTTVRSAAKHLPTICPYCACDLAHGSGSRRTMQLPVIGAVGAGKTHLFSSGLVAMEAQLRGAGGSLTPLSPAAQDFFAAAQNAVDQRQGVGKTPQNSQPEGLPVIINSSGKVLELQLMDAAGETFTNWDTSQGLTYIDGADVILLVVDPLGFPQVYEAVTHAGRAGDVVVAAGDQEDSYASVVDRLRAENVRLNKRHLGVVISKADVLQGLEIGRTLDQAAGGNIRDWLIEQGQDGFVRRLDDDFTNVTYFAVDSRGSLSIEDPHNPIHVFQWALDVAGTKISIVPIAPKPVQEPTLEVAQL